MSVTSESLKVYKAAWYQKNKARLRLKARPSRTEYNRSYYATNRERLLETHQDWQKRNPDKARCNGRAHKARKYGTTLEDFEAYCLTTGNRCEICQELVVPLHIDHDHNTNKFRGALCGNCNRGLGIYQDNPELLRAAASYLETKRVNTDR